MTVARAALLAAAGSVSTEFELSGKGATASTGSATAGVVRGFSGTGSAASLAEVDILRLFKSLDASGVTGSLGKAELEITGTIYVEMGAVGSSASSSSGELTIETTAEMFSSRSPWAYGGAAYGKVSYGGRKVA